MSKTIVSINDTPMHLSEKLSRIQIEFKAEKSKFNKFGNYKFRSAEDILEALKPFNQKYNVYFTINETLINANPPIMASVATIFDCDSLISIDCQSVVGIDLEQKGMAMPQRYGSASSYAKKYALGNLLLIDDTADADATNNHGNAQEKYPKEKQFLVEGTEAFKKAIDYLAGGGELSTIETKYQLTASVKEALTKK
jgi:hypothetical protein